MPDQLIAAGQFPEYAIPASAYGAEPFTAVELDALPDSARFWATIEAARDYVTSAIRAELDAAASDANDKQEDAGTEAMKEGARELATNIRERLQSVARDAFADTLQDAMWQALSKFIEDLVTEEEKKLQD